MQSFILADDIVTMANRNSNSTLFWQQQPTAMQLPAFRWPSIEWILQDGVEKQSAIINERREKHIPTTDLQKQKPKDHDELPALSYDMFLLLL